VRDVGAVEEKRAEVAIRIADDMGAGGKACLRVASCQLIHVPCVSAYYEPMGWIYIRDDGYTAIYIKVRVENEYFDHNEQPVDHKKVHLRGCLLI
jgi:hypothetical protein